MAALYLGKANHQVTQKHKKHLAQSTQAEGTAHFVRVHHSGPKKSKKYE